MADQESAMEKKKVTLTPHLSFTHVEQGGAANNRNVSLLMKSGLDLTQEQIEILKSLVGDGEFVEKASYSGLREAIEGELSKTSSENEWRWVVDFDDSVLVFSTEQGLYYTSYKVEGGEVVLGDTGQSVERLVSYEDASGEVVLSEKVTDVPQNVILLIKKSFDKIRSDGKLKDIYKSKYMEGKNKMEQEIQKAVDIVKSEFTEKLDKATSDLKATQEALEAKTQEADALQKALDKIEEERQKERAAARKVTLKSVINDEGQVEELLKALDPLDDEAFAAVAKTYGDKNKAIEGSNLFSQESVTSQEEGDGESNLMKMLKAKYANQ